MSNHNDAAPAKISFRVFVGWDHAVMPLVQDAVIDALSSHCSVRSVQSFGPRDVSNRVDYPDVAAQVCTNVIEKNTQLAAGEIPIGVLICGSGIGMSIAANKFPGIRAALCHDYYTAEMCRRHNNANVLCMGARVTGVDVILQMMRVFLATDFEGGRHATRVDKIAGLESMVKSDTVFSCSSCAAVSPASTTIPPPTADAPAPDKGAASPSKAATSPAKAAVPAPAANSPQAANSNGH